MTTDDTYTDRLSDYLDGELEPGEQAETERHLASCANCRNVLHELRGVVERARTLDDLPPAVDLWPGVLKQIDRGSSASRRQAGTGVLRILRGAVGRRVAFTLPQLAAAGIALMVLSGGLVWLAQSDPRADFPLVSADSATAGTAITPARFADAGYEQAVEDLEAILEQGRSRLDPETVRVLEDNLRAIDLAIEQSRRALASDPANTYLNSHLARAKQRKLALLRRASGFASAGS